MFDSPDQRVRRFLLELRRRNVYRVAVAYLAVAFIGFQVASLLIPATILPPWTDEFFLFFLIVGFPVALVIAWAFELTPHGVRRTPRAETRERSSDEPEGETTRFFLALLLVATALLAAGLWLISGPGLPGGIRSNEPPAVRPGEVSPNAVAVFPFSVDGSPELAYLGDGLVKLLATKLDGAGDLRTVDPRALLQATESDPAPTGGTTMATEVANRFGAGLYLVGDVVEIDGRIHLSAALYRTDGDPANPISEGAVSGSVADLFRIVDELTSVLLSGMSGGPAARVQRIAAVTTSRLPALRAFLEGETLFRRGQFDGAVDAFRRAVAADSLFALAHYRLSLAAEWNLQDELARRAAEDAARLASRLSERDRRMLDAFLVRRRGKNAEAEVLYRSILGTYPNSMEAWLDLGEVLFHANPLRGRSFTDAKEALYRVLEFAPSHATALIHLARIAAFERDGPELDSLVTRFMRLEPAPARRTELEALRTFVMEDSEGREAMFRRLENADDLGVALAVWASGVYARDLTGAVRSARLLTEPHRSLEARRLGYAWLAHFDLARGRWSDARERLVELGELSQGIALEYRALLCSIPFVPESGCDPAELEVALEQLDPATLPVSGNPSVVFTAHDELHPLIRHYLLGRTRAEMGEEAEALQSVDALSRVELPRTAGSLEDDLARSIRAHLLIRQGREDEALQQLSGARMETWYGQTLASPLYARVLERYVQAELLRRLGRLEEALRWYASLVEMSPFEVPYLAMSHLRRAQIHDQRGEVRAARDQYRRFLSLWSDPDPELRHLVAEARGALDSMAEVRYGSGARTTSDARSDGEIPAGGGLEGEIPLRPVGN